MGKYLTLFGGIGIIYLGYTMDWIALVILGCIELLIAIYWIIDDNKKLN